MSKATTIIIILIILAIVGGYFIYKQKAISEVNKNTTIPSQESNNSDVDITSDDNQDTVLSNEDVIPPQT